MFFFLILDLVIDFRFVVDFLGGELVVIDRFYYYLWEIDVIVIYKEIRNGFLGVDYFIKFLVW